jgi:hypothetical protein
MAGIIQLPLIADKKSTLLPFSEPCIDGFRDDVVFQVALRIHLTKPGR